jgi:hypothetical protein
MGTGTGGGPLSPAVKRYKHECGQLQTGAHVTNERAAMQGDLTSIRKLHVTAKFRMVHNHKIYKQQCKSCAKIMEINLYSPYTGQSEAQHRKCKTFKIVCQATVESD